MTVKPTVAVENDDKSPLTLADLRVLLATAETAGVPDTAQLSGVVKLNGALRRVGIR